MRQSAGPWIKHPIAEDQRGLQGLIDTLTEDCVHEIPATGQRWEVRSAEITSSGLRPGGLSIFPFAGLSNGSILAGNVTMRAVKTIQWDCPRLIGPPAGSQQVCSD